ncbi:phage protein NinX family protein [Klebsiella quasipneumoniae]|uniref:phage protein NinX family protein n=1 Tax=Klebsiella quasipneumoniae TaxID=1463165 RepID=UPI00352A59CA
MKTANLTGSALDWAVAEAEGGKRISTTRKEFGLNVSKKIIPPYSSRWSYCGPLIERHSLSLTGGGKFSIAVVRVGCGCVTQSGDTLLIAFCRALVAAKFGDEVDIPEWLID